MNFILVNWVRYCTKEAVKTLKLVTIGSAIVIAVVCIKYKPAYKVTISGETIGFVDNIDIIKAKIDKYMNDTSGNIAFREIANMPEYEFKLINRDKKTEEKEVMLAVQNLTTTTYKTYAVTSDGEQKAIVATQQEAESIINELKTNLNPEVDLKLGIVEVYETENSSVSKDNAMLILNEFKTAKVTEYETKKAEAEAAAKAAEEAKRAEEAKKRKKTIVSEAQSIATTTRAEASGNINGMALSIPVSGSITSRFGVRSSSRSSAHTGLDISAPSGTGIRPITSGTVTYAGYKGSYGNLVIINHGGGVESYYAHCSAIYVSVGDQVGPGTTISAVGSTGNSTGPHLHLEIRLGGSPVNPQNYLY